MMAIRNLFVQYIGSVMNIIYDLERGVTEIRTWDGRKWAPVVRCMDCKWYRPTYSALSTSGYWCDENDRPASSNGFCSLAERKEGAE